MQQVSQGQNPAADCTQGNLPEGGATPAQPEKRVFPAGDVDKITTKTERKTMSNCCVAYTNKHSSPTGRA